LGLEPVVMPILFFLKKWSLGATSELLRIMARSLALANAQCCFRVTPPPHAAAPRRAPRRHVPFGCGYSEPLLGATAKRGPAPLRRKMEEEREGPGGRGGGGGPVRTARAACGGGCAGAGGVRHG